MFSIIKGVGKGAAAGRGLPVRLIGVDPWLVAGGPHALRR
jgi:hypothetical protein